MVCLNLKAPITAMVDLRLQNRQLASAPLDSVTSSAESAIDRGKIQ